MPCRPNPTCNYPLEQITECRKAAIEESMIVCGKANQSTGEAWLAATGLACVPACLRAYRQGQTDVTDLRCTNSYSYCSCVLEPVSQTFTSILFVYVFSHRHPWAFYLEFFLYLSVSFIYFVSFTSRLVQHIGTGHVSTTPQGHLLRWSLSFDFKLSKYHRLLWAFILSPSVSFYFLTFHRPIWLFYLY